MAFAVPDKLTELDTAALETLINEGLDEHKRLSAIKDEDLTDEQIDELEAVGTAITAIQGQKTALAEQATQRADRIAAAKAAVEQPAAEEPAAKADEPAATETPTEAPAAEPVVASASSTPSIAQRAAATQAEPEVPAEVAKTPTAVIVAAAGVRDFGAGEVIPDIKKLGEAFMKKIASFGPVASGAGDFSQRHAVAKIERTIDPALHLTGHQESDYAVLEHAVDQSRLPGESLVAAGGWCAPSETLYDFPEMRETLSGVLSFPEVTWSRGGINFTQGPDFGDVYTQTGFVQTEAQAEAGQEKNFITIDCPEFEEARLEASGYGIRSNYLTDVTFPELLAYYTSAAAIAYGHKTNSRVINKAVTALGAPLSAAGLGSAISDVLAAFEASVMRTRYTYRMAETATVEGFAPIWLRAVLRADLSYRNGVDYFAITDAQLDTWFRSRGVALQFIYDWQDFPTTGTTIAFPKTVDVALYPAGTFIKGVNDVITLDAVHDFDSMKRNTYTAMFFEEAMQLTRRRAGGFIVRIPLDYSGRTGATDITSFARPNAANAAA
jgi:hypothetical protein